jgi:hypothetical protein
MIEEVAIISGHHQARNFLRINRCGAGACGAGGEGVEEFSKFAKFAK